MRFPATLAWILLVGGIAAAESKGVGVELYGYIKVDASWNDSRVANGNFARWAEPENVNANDSDFYLTANETRLGLKLAGPEYGHMKTRGQVEADFYGGGAENKSSPMLRHAYLEVSWPGWDFAVLAGQTSDVVSPGAPGTLNYTVLWWAGNIGYRRPQVRLSKGLDIGGSRLDFAAAAVRTITQSATWFTGDAGADAGFPSAQARIGLTFPGWTAQKMVVGVSGHIGQEEWDISKSGNSRYMRSWAGAVDFTVPLCEKLLLRGEGWMGENLAALNGCVGQCNIPLASMEKMRAKGGWLMLSAGPYKFWKYGLGVGTDDPDNRDLMSATDKRNNTAVFANLTYDITPAAAVGVEFTQWMTGYNDHKKDAEAARLQVSLIHRF